MNNFENCGYYTDGECNICGMGTDGEDTFCKYCKDNPNCYYKQLKRLEQENFELKESLKCFQKPEVVKVLTDWRTGELDNLKAENETLKSQLDFEVQKKEVLETENEQLKALCDTYRTCYQAKHSDIKGLLFKYKQTLQEIKEIAKDNIIGCFSNKCDLADKILEKITKAGSEG